MADAIVQPFVFEGKSYTNAVKLAESMAVSWKAGREALFSGRVGNYIKRIDRSLYNACRTAESDYKAKPEEGDVTFLKWLCKVKGMKNLYWRGVNYGGVTQIAGLLRKGYDADFSRLLNYMVQEQLFSVFIKNSGAPERLVDNVHYLEKCYVKKDTKYNKRGIWQLMYYVLSDTKTFSFDGRLFRNVQELAAYLQEFADVSRWALDSKLDQLYTDQYNLIPALEGWLINIGCQKELTLWREKYQTGTSDNDVEEEVIFDEDEDEKEQAQHQDNEAFSKDVYGFESDFLQMLTDYPDSLTTPNKFETLMKDLFPEKRLQAYLIITLYKMDIVSAIRDAAELDDVFTTRFIKRLQNDFEVKEDFAKWAASVWCVCYGEKILNKKNRVIIYKVL